MGVQSVDDESVPLELRDFLDIIGTSGTLPGVYQIKIHPTANGVVHAARRQPVVLMPRIIEELNKMVDNGF